MRKGKEEREGVSDEFCDVIDNEALNNVEIVLFFIVLPLVDRIKSGGKKVL